ncbi:ABC transporter ATP-binding protein [Lacticaseibacillus paracasei]|uniref:Oligopeptide transport ATP-binding protein OppD n=1 Tax=Lacticaseibacillus paracasei subsp. paracasei Lpp41 TaxID=1256208 RepID=A0A829HA84_LACPA|nr:ABC transporter ATP-binding protein [Lacticaseibacillus paracasei]EKQ25099.1 ATP-binding component of an ABC superfamily oligopeptide transporter [Lacticaseibacillus casei UW4]EPC75382.1 Oligopeptide transport ATP-binding protein OppD [Lacticaseibacillus paracasei subsp. paracasei Lpp41]OJF73464.1 peptide ABC transporter ATP-binding protein [Lacticaseibacillus casei]ATG99396.1 peptide ABC transporter ATP-binding protein [Lacticaseibacillus paracasei]MBB1168459.1 ABC transporter ATP-binding 
MSKILEVKDLQIDFATYAGPVHAIRNVSFDLNKGETLAIVGESGSGKSVTVRTVMGLLAPNAKITHGEVLFNGEDILKKSEKQLNAMRGNDVSMIFQDPMTSLDPTMTIGKQVAEPLLLHSKISKADALKEAERVLDLVGIKDAGGRLKDYPHQFSGGQRQRIVIAIAIINHPQILLADEPTTALDVTIQAQIIHLLKEIQSKIDTSIIFITHDLGVVAGIADRVAVMYAGKIVEYGTVDEIFYNAQHPYTWGLLEAMPTLETKSDRLYAIPGTPPDLLDPPKGDAFAPRNPYAMAIDLEQEPPFFKISPTHSAATWLLAPGAPKVELPPEIARRHALWASKHQDEKVVN